MTVIAGIDEAGFGPVLGPMVVSAAAFRVPDDQADASLWGLLAGAVGRKPGRKSPLIAYADSKKLYAGLRGAKGLEHLERGVLAMLAAQGRRPDSLMRLLEIIAPGAPASASAYPWYGGQDVPLPHSITTESLALSGNALGERMRRAGVELLAIRSEVVLEGEFNRLVAATDNKSTVLFDVTCRLLMHLWRMRPAERLVIHADHQGGRVRYLPGLLRVFEGCAFKVLEEAETLSAYRMTDGPRVAELHFRVACEEQQLPVALASMTCKYVRELFMGMLNRFWAGRVPGLAPTGGYHEDGTRFFQEVRPTLRRLGLDEPMMLRSR